DIRGRQYLPSEIGPHALDAEFEILAGQNGVGDRQLRGQRQDRGRETVGGGERRLVVVRDLGGNLIGTGRGRRVGPDNHPVGLEHYVGGGRRERKEKSGVRVEAAC